MNGTIRTTPVGNGCEPVEPLLADYWPILKHHRRTSMVPTQAACGNDTMCLADILANCEIEIMIPKPGTWVVLFMPELRKAGVIVVVNLAMDLILNLRQRQMSAQVEKQSFFLGKRSHSLDRHSVGLFAVPIN